MAVVTGKVDSINIRKKSFKTGSIIKHKYYIDIKYSYKYNGKAYQNDKSEYCSGYTSLVFAQMNLERIKNECKDVVLIFVNPEDPQDSLLLGKYFAEW